MANGKISGSVAGEQRGHDHSSGRAEVYLSDEQDLPALVGDHCNGNGKDVCEHAGCDRLADRQRIYTAAACALLLQRLPGRLSGLGESEIWNTGAGKRKVGHGVLEPDLHRLEADSGAAAVEWRAESWLGAGLRPVSI